MYNFPDAIQADPGHTRQFRSGVQLIAEFTCPLENAQEDMWSHSNYFVYVLEGRKDWQSADGQLELHVGDMAFVKKGGCIVKQYFGAPFCVLLFFMTDEFICEALRSVAIHRPATGPVKPLETIHVTPAISGFMHGMWPHFQGAQPMEPVLVELKLRELVLLIAGDPHNQGFVAGFLAMMQGRMHERLRRVMEDNYAFNLPLEAYARMSGRSLSAFKRDFHQVFSAAPGRWLRQQRLRRAKLMLASGDRQVSEVAFQCGFENLSHFSRVFKEEFGHSPVELKRLAAG
ncbi:MAG: helix-turn-helix transcriptional regulator [Flavobacteriales bacterium]|nr:helix-turn-helix transcriptional regulator [Flavobacteriales bacterium]MBP9081100.1 helix-turn-helix transcriptional regulator [Flavobacteriales bacterium]